MIEISNHICIYVISFICFKIYQLVNLMLFSTTFSLEAILAVIWLCRSFSILFNMRVISYKCFLRKSLQGVFTLSFNSALLLFAVNYNCKKVKTTFTSPNHQGEYPFPHHLNHTCVMIGLACVRNVERVTEYTSKKTFDSHV